jgi:rhamnosyltransferase
VQKSKKCLVLLASYNGKDWIQDQIGSIFSQRNVEVYLQINDDCSSDDTIEVINGLSQYSDRINLSVNKLPSGSAGQNFMSMFRNIDASTFDYVAFSDQDDFWLPDKISDSIDLLRKSGAWGISSSVKAFWPNGKTTILHQSLAIKRFDFLFEGGGQGCSFLLTQDLFNLVKNFCISNQDLTNNFYYHDWLVYLLCRTSNEKWIFNDAPSLMYRQHFNNDTGARSGVSAILSRVNLIRSGWYKDQILMAFKIAKRAGYNSDRIIHFESQMLQSNTLQRKLKLMYLVARYGRRKTLDRFILIFAVMCGYI